MNKENLLKIGRILLDNKMAFAVVVASLFILFIDDESVLDAIQLNNKIKTLEVEKTYYQKDINNNKRRISELKSNKENLEKFARENYLMKRKNEDIFMLIEENK